MNYYRKPDFGKTELKPFISVNHAIDYSVNDDEVRIQIFDSF